MINLFADTSGLFVQFSQIGLRYDELHGLIDHLFPLLNFGMDLCGVFRPLNDALCIKFDLQ